MSHLHRIELQKRFPQSHSTQQQLPLTGVAGPVLVGWTPCPATYPVDVLIALRRVLSKINPCSKHATDVGVPFVEPFLDDGVDERRSVEEHPLIALVVVLFGHFTPAVGIPFPELDISDLLDFDNLVSGEESARMALVPVLSDSRLHLLFDS